MQVIYQFYSFNVYIVMVGDWKILIRYTPHRNSGSRNNAVRFRIYENSWRLFETSNNEMKNTFVNL